MKLRLLASLMASLFMTQMAFAGKDGGAGNVECSEYIEMVDKVASDFLDVIGQDNVDKYTRLINVEALWNAQVGLKCVPVSDFDESVPAAEKDSDAWSNIDTKTTQLKYERWSGRLIQDKIRLVTHELAVLASLESSGRYSRSKMMRQILLDFPRTIGDRLKADTVIYNHITGEVTFLTPYFLIGDSKHYFGWFFTSELGQCRFLGYDKYMRSSRAGTTYRRPVLKFRSDGGIDKILNPVDSGDYYNIVGELTCK